MSGVDHGEHGLAAAECIVDRDRGQHEAEPDERAGDDAGAQRECVEVGEDAVKRPGHDQFAHERHDERRALRQASISSGQALRQAL